MVNNYPTKRRRPREHKRTYRNGKITVINPGNTRPTIKWHTLPYLPRNYEIVNGKHELKRIDPSLFNPNRNIWENVYLQFGVDLAKIPEDIQLNPRNYVWTSRQMREFEEAWEPIRKKKMDDTGRYIPKLSEDVEHIMFIGPTIKPETAELPSYEERQAQKEAHNKELNNALANLPESLVKTAVHKVMIRTTYGIRREIVEEPSYELMWSNGSASWRVNHARGLIQPRVTINLDADTILVPTNSAIQAEALAKILPALPLYAASTEAWTKSQISSEESALIWSLGQIERMKREKFQEENK